MNSYTSSNLCIMVAGSISPNEKNHTIVKAQTFIKTFVTNVINVGGEFVGYFSADYFNNDNISLSFDWTVARTLFALSSNIEKKIYLYIVTSPNRLKKITENDRNLLIKLVSLNLAKFIYLDDEIITGTNIGTEQIKYATMMLAIGGGKGVSDRAKKMIDKELPVFPIDLEICGSCNDGEGAQGILKKFKTNPSKYLKFTGTNVINWIDTLSLETGILNDQQISEKILEIFQEEGQKRFLKSIPSILILTALPQELAAVKKVFDISSNSSVLEKNGIKLWTKQLKDINGNEVNCNICCFGRAGNVTSSQITTTLINSILPRTVIMVGIAGGLASKYKIGDVIFAEQIVSYETAVLKGDGQHSRSETIQLNQVIHQDITSYLSDSDALKIRLKENLKLIRKKFRYEKEFSKKLIPKLATVASGEKLFKDNESFLKLQSIHDKIDVVEMEGVGVFKACALGGVGVLMIRGISDFGSNTKNSDSHNLAAVRAATLTLDYVKNTSITLP